MRACPINPAAPIERWWRRPYERRAQIAAVDAGSTSLSSADRLIDKMKRRSTGAGAIPGRGAGLSPKLTTSTGAGIAGASDQI